MGSLFYHEYNICVPQSEGRKVSENLSHASHTSTSVRDVNIETVKKAVLENRRVVIREIAEDLNISYGSIQMRSTSSRQRDNVVKESSFINLIITGDETWVYEYDVENIQKSSEWRSKMSQNRKKQNSLKALKAIPAEDIVMVWLRSLF